MSVEWMAKARAFNALTKPRLSALSVITGMVGYAVAPSSFEWKTCIGLALGMSLAAGSAAALNQWMEHKRDALMERTCHRPIPSGEIGAGTALLFGLGIGVVGLLILQWLTNTLAMTLTLATLVSYLAVYTPSKSITPWCTAIGTIPGALPPMIGWAASEGTLAVAAWLLFGLMVAWQIPHFMAIAWTYREDYAKASLPMISVVDGTGRSAAVQSTVFTVLLIFSALGFVWFDVATWVFGAASLLLGFWMLWLCLQFLLRTERSLWAKRLFFFTLIYLTIAFGLLVIDVNFL